jgi:hypothetical protein
MTTVIKGDSNINLDFSTGGRITGDFSNATIANRVMFKSSFAGATTSVGAVPSGDPAAASFIAFGLSDPNNSHFIGLVAPSSGDVRINAGITGTGSYLPMAFYTGGSERMRVDTSGNLLVGVTSGTAKLQIGNASAFTPSNSTVVNAAIRTQGSYGGGIVLDDGGLGSIWMQSSGTLMGFGLGTTSGVSGAMYINSSGNVGIGTSSPANKLHVSGNVTIANYGNIGATDNTAGVSISGGSTAGNGGQINVRGGSFSGNTAGIEFVTNNTERARIDSTGARSTVIPSGSTLYPAFDCRAWINFNGTGTPAIRGSGNFSSITDNGTGDYTLNFTTSLPDTNYCPVVGGDFSQGATRDNGMYLPTNFTFATSSLRISVTNYAGAYTDIDTVLVSIFR